LIFCTSCSAMAAEESTITVATFSTDSEAGICTGVSTEGTCHSNDSD
jgi:hypothetical protein